MDANRTQLSILLLATLLASASCHSHLPIFDRADADEPGADGDGDVDADIDADIDADSDAPPDGDADGDGDLDRGADTDVLADGDADGDVDGCHAPFVAPIGLCSLSYCDPRPFMWNGNTCVYHPLPCSCDGDCDARYATLEECHQAYTHCPVVADVPRYRDSTLVFRLNAGYADLGPYIAVNSHGCVRYCTLCGRGEPVLWDRCDVSLGVAFANELFGLVATTDFDELPNPSAHDGGDCYPRLNGNVVVGDSNRPFDLSYVTALDLRPELSDVYELLNDYRCFFPDEMIMPDVYCVSSVCEIDPLLGPSECDGMDNHQYCDDSASLCRPDGDHTAWCFPTEHCEDCCRGTCTEAHQSGCS